MIEALLVLGHQRPGSDQQRAPRPLGGGRGRPGAGRAPGIAGLDLTVESDLGPAETTGDQQLIERMVWNLVDNAVRHKRARRLDPHHDRPDPGRRRAAHRQQRGRGAARCRAHAGRNRFRRIRKVSDGGVGLGLSIAQSVSTGARRPSWDVRSRPERRASTISLTLRG